MKRCDVFEFFKDRYPPESCPALAAQRAAWAKHRPLEGLTILDGTPLFCNTLLKQACLLAGGADVWAGTGPTMPFDSEALKLLPQFGIGSPSPERLAHGFDAILDCAGAFADIPSRLGYAELTRSGASVYADKAAPVLLTDAGRIKRFETALGTGDGLVRALEQLNLRPLNGSHVLVVGCGKVGGGILFRCLRAGAHPTAAGLARDKSPGNLPFVSVEDRDAFTQAVEDADIIITATGVRHALRPWIDGDVLNRCHALLANMGVEDEFGPEVREDRVLNRKRPLNFILNDPTRIDYIDPTLALHNAALLRLLSNVPNGIHPPTPDEEAPILNTLPRPLLQELDDFEAFYFG